MNEHELDSLLALLDDPDDSVFKLVLEEILKKDISVVDHLEHIWETSLDGLVQERIEYIIQQIQFNDTRLRIQNWASQPSIDLFEGFFLITRYHYPELKLKPVQVQLDKIKKDIWLEFRNSQTSLEKITILNHIFFHHYKFNIDRTNPDSPQNCYLNRILDHRKGNPISLAILYVLVARSLGLPVHYIDIQNTPLVGYFDKEIAQLVHGEDFENPVLFYVNPSNKGAIIGPKELEYIHNHADVNDRLKLREPCADRLIIKRLVEKLILSYQELGVHEKVEYLNEIVSIL